jgi:hypothetical protein
MTPAATAAPPRRSRPPARATRLAGLAAALALAAGGCGRAPSGSTTGDPAVGPTKGDPWKAAAARLKKDTDLAGCKSALTVLGADAGPEDGKKPLALTDEALAALTAVVPLSADDAKEIRGAAFTDYDAVYLTDCFYLRDAANSLALAGLPPQRRAELAFDWVCRQVYLHPWVVRQGANSFATTALPPTAVLRRGFGSGLERMYVFLALLQQLDLDACLVGGPGGGRSTVPFTLAGAGQVPDTPAAREAVAARAPRGPFWAVGVLVGSDVRLFDPWRGRPFPMTLAQLRADPGAARAWFEDKANASGATVEDAKKATAFLAVPVSSLAPRMAALDAHLRRELGLRASFDPVALRAAFPDPKPAFWNAPDDPFAYGRAGRSYLPAEMGGSDRTEQSPMRLYESSLREQIPTAAVVSDPNLDRRLADLPPAARLRLDVLVRGSLGVAFVEPPNPRERIQRGQFHDAARDAVAKQEAFALGRERLRANKDAARNIDGWIEEARARYEDVTRAQTLTLNKAAEAEALQAVEKHWRTAGAQFLVDRATAEVGQAEASLLLALCNHELAERLQVRLERASSAEAGRLRPDARAAWEKAKSAWETYDQSSSAHAGFPGRAAHAKGLEARAVAMAAADAEK